MENLMNLFIQEKVAYDMYKSSKSNSEKEYYKEELEKIRNKINNR